jgi:anhydro-N-acetylmuramic acid kinase
VTLLPALQLKQAITGFDTGTGNGLMDAWCFKHKQCHYDNNGEWAASGSCDDELLTLMLADPYFDLAIPKSTGREYFNLDWLETQLKLVTHSIKAEDVQTTLCVLTARCITDAIKQYARNYQEVYICGGGAHNAYLLQQLTLLLPEQRLASTEQLGLSPDWVEAYAFAWLAKQTINQQAGNIPEVTGASKKTILGGIYYSSNDAS